MLRVGLGSGKLWIWHLSFSCRVVRELAGLVQSASARLAHSSISKLTSGCHERILIEFPTLALVAFAIGLQDGLSRSIGRILVVERDLERRFGGFVSWCFGIEALQAGIERLSRSAGLQMANGILLVVCGECSHGYGHIGRVVG